MTPRWMRFRTATGMALIALVALGLGGYRWRQAALVQAQIDQAAGILHRWQPHLDLAAYDGRLAAKSADGAFQQVRFTKKSGAEHVVVTIPLGSQRASARVVNPQVRPPVAARPITPDSTLPPRSMVPSQPQGTP